MHRVHVVHMHLEAAPDLVLALVRAATVAGEKHGQGPRILGRNDGDDEDEQARVRVVRKAFARPASISVTATANEALVAEHRRAHPLRDELRICGSGGDVRDEHCGRVTLWLEIGEQVHCPPEDHVLGIVGEPP